MIEWFDDLVLGMRFKSPEKRVTREDIKRFASEFDPQAYHLDEAAAERSVFKGLAASGWHGSRDILDGETGFWIMAGSDRCDPTRFTDRLGMRWTVEELQQAAPRLQDVEFHLNNPFDMLRGR